MDTKFWLERWQNNQIAFHEGKPNRLLEENFSALALPPDSRVFLPLCGKTRDIAWLLGHGYRVAGAELIATAIDQLFDELEVTPVISGIGDHTHYSADGIDIFVGDIFELTAERLGPVDAVYDRAALVALPDDMRGRYAAHLPDLTGNAPQLLISYEYDQSEMGGPPFSVSEAEIRRHYQDRYDLTRLASVDIPGGLKRKCAATETVWLLRK
ncbi:MAG: thiopurine S-methyltransferase [Alphaproteobacteria bacterium]